MFRFEHPYYLYVLLIIPIMILGQVVFEIWRKKRFSAQINPELRVQINSKWSGTKIWIKLSIYSLALSLVVFPMRPLTLLAAVPRRFTAGALLAPGLAAARV